MSVRGAAALLAAFLSVGCTTDTRYGSAAGGAGAGPGAAGGAGGAEATGGSAGGAIGGSSGGSSGSAGSPIAGSAGMAGGSARGGTAGGDAPGGTTGAAGGTAGKGGGAGSTAGSGGAGSTLKLEYATSSATATIYAVRVTNLGPVTPLISVLKARYYFSDDSSNKMNAATLDSATWHPAAGADVDLRASGGCAVISTYPAAPASAYADVGCSLASPLNANDTLTFTIHFDPASQAAANDYSYLATGGVFEANPHMLLLQNGLIVSGSAPF